MTVFDEKGDAIKVNFDTYCFDESAEDGSEASEYKKVLTPTNCTLQKILVKEGQVVNVGD